MRTISQLGKRVGLPSKCVDNKDSVNTLRFYVCLCVCVCVCVMEVGCSWSGTRLVTRDLRNSEPRTRLRILENIQAWAGTAGAAIREQYIVEADAIGEQQLKRML